MFAIRLGDREHPAVVYDYTPTRERAGPEKFLATYKGYLQLDAYPAYDKFFLDPKRELVEVGCWAHARRHIFQARDTDPSRMGAVLAYIGQLYAVEKRARQSGIRGEDLWLPRDSAARPVVKELHAYLQRIQPELLPKSDAGQAVAYILKNWLALARYLEDADLAIDNNRTERLPGENLQRSTASLGARLSATRRVRSRPHHATQGGRCAASLCMSF